MGNSSGKFRRKNNIKLMIIVLIVLMFVFGVVLFKLTAGKNQNVQNSEGTHVLSYNSIVTNSQNSCSVAFDIASKINSGEITESNINYENIFDDSVILGDSITEGLSVYGFLSENIVYCRVGGSVLNSEQMIKDAASTLPSTAFFSYGTNDMGMYSGDSKAFTEKYRGLIEQFKEISPDTKIYVNSIPKPSDSKISSGGYFYKWEDFNLDIKQMCDAIDAEYIDNTDLLIEHPEYYAGDGIHVSTSYYPKWMARMVSAANLWSRLSFIYPDSN